MGLDMHVYKTQDELPAQTNFQCTSREWFGEYTKEFLDEFGERPYVIADELFYWRKHPDLHGWMGRLYKEKGGIVSDLLPSNDVDDSGNFFGPVELTADDVERLSDAVENNELPRTTGFFFGESTKDCIKSDRVFIRKAKQAFEDGYRLFYKASW